MDRGVIATATELFASRHFPGVVAVCTDALDGEPEHVGMLMLRARAHIALRRDLQAQADLRDLIRIDPACALAYRLLGELSARRDQHESAAIFFREALRLEPGDRAAADWLAIVDGRGSPPAVSAAEGRRGSIDGSFRPAPEPEGAPSERLERAARGTEPPPEATTTPFPRADPPVRESRGAAPWKTPTPTPWPHTIAPDVADDLELDEADVIAPPAPRDRARALDPQPPRGMVKRIATPLPIAPTPRVPPRRPNTRGAVPELPGFDAYLVDAGIVSRGGLRAAQAYQRSMGVALSTAIVALGLATPQRVEWAAVSHQSQLARARR